MKPFSERSPRKVGAVSLGVILAVLLITLNLSHLPFANSSSTYHADLSDAGALVSGEQVTVAGIRVGTISGLHLAGDHVRLDFSVRSGLHLGSQTTLAVKVLSPLGQEFVQLTSAGPGRLAPGATIPESRTSGTPTLLTTLNQAGETFGAIDEKQLARALAVASDDLSGTTPSAVASAISGMGRLSQIIDSRQQQLNQLVTAANQVVTTLGANRGQLVDLIGQANLIMSVVQERQAEIKQVLDATTTLSRSISSILTYKQGQLSTMLANLNAASAVLAKDSSSLANAMPLLSGLSNYLANATGSGPFFDAIAPTLLIDDHLVQECSPPGVTPPYSRTSKGCPK